MCHPPRGGYGEAVCFRLPVFLTKQKGVAYGRAFSLSKKSGYAGFFRHRLKKRLRPKAQTPRPPGKAGRYELILEDLRVLQTSQRVFFTV